jgi:hypothetical protein
MTGFRKTIAAVAAAAAGLRPLLWRYYVTPKPSAASTATTSIHARSGSATEPPSSAERSPAPSSFRLSEAPPRPGAGLFRCVYRGGSKP